MRMNRINAQLRQSGIDDQFTSNSPNTLSASLLVRIQGNTVQSFTVRTLLLLIIGMVFFADWLSSYYTLLPSKVMWLNDLAIILLFFISFARSCMTSMFEIDKLFLLFLGLFLASCLVSAVYNHVPAEIFIAGVRRPLLYIVLGIALRNLNFNVASFEFFFGIILFLLLIQPGVAILEYVTKLAGVNPTDMDIIDAAIGTFSIKNGCATISIFIIFLFFYFFYETRKIFSLLNAYFIAAFVLAFSGGSYYLFAMALLVMIVCYNEIFNLKTNMIFVIIGLLLISIAFHFISPDTAQYLDIRQMWQQQSLYFVEAKQFGDLAALVTTFTDISQNWVTLLFGLGPGMFSETLISSYVPPHVMYYWGMHLPTQTNALSLFLAEMGVIGISLYVIMGLYVTFRIHKLYKETDYSRIKRVCFAYVAFAIVFLLGALYRSYWISAPECFFFWGIPSMLPPLAANLSRHE